MADIVLQVVVALTQIVLAWWAVQISVKQRRRRAAWVFGTIGLIGVIATGLVGYHNYLNQRKSEAEHGEIKELVVAGPGEARRARLTVAGVSIVALEAGREAIINVRVRNIGALPAIGMQGRTTLEWVVSPFQHSSAAEDSKRVEDEAFLKLRKTQEWRDYTDELATGQSRFSSTHGPKLAAQDFVVRDGLPLIERRPDQILLLVASIRYKDRDIIRELEVCRYIRNQYVMNSCSYHGREQ